VCEHAIFLSILALTRYNPHMLLIIGHHSLFSISSPSLYIIHERSEGCCYDTKQLWWLANGTHSWLLFYIITPVTCIIYMYIYILVGILYKVYYTCMWLLLSLVVVIMQLRYSLTLSNWQYDCSANKCWVPKQAVHKYLSPSSSSSSFSPSIIILITRIKTGVNQEENGAYKGT